MSSQGHREAAHARHLLEAAAWRTRLTETELESSEAFRAWLTADPANEAAWRQVQTTWNFFDEQATAPELIELRRAALADARRAGRGRWVRTAVSSRLARLVLAAGLAALVAGVLLFRHLGADVYRTGAGERRVVTLTDGSQISLDTQSEVRVAYSEGARNLTLVRGQARFDVTRDVERPFSVSAGGRKVVATGTSFNIDLLGRDLRVTLIEGSVVVLPDREHASAGRQLAPAVGTLDSTEADTEDRGHESSAPRGTSNDMIELAMGQQLIVSRETDTRIVPANLESATAWQSGQLVFDDEPLSSVVLRVSRYSSRSVRVVDAASEMRISGVFKTGDVDSFVATITSYLPVRADISSDGSVELKSL